MSKVDYWNKVLIQVITLKKYW